MAYQKLFSKGGIAGLELRNRVVMVPMGTQLASADGDVTENEIKYFEERARGGVGLIVTEVTAVDWELGLCVATQPRVDANRFIPMLARLADAVHKYDTHIFMQLTHAGRQGKTAITGGRQLVAPSEVMCMITREEPRAMSSDEIKVLIRKFADGAFRCKTAGLDGVELHAAHGYLLNQFISPLTNRRTDEFGGTLEKRLRVVKEIIEAIRDSCGAFPIGVRISVDEFVEGGITLEMGRDVCAYLEEFGADVLSVTGGIYESLPKVIEPVYYPQGWRIHLAEAIKEVVSIPVITAGVIREPQFAEDVLNDGKADFIGIGRGLLADPEWAEKARRGDEARIRKCISCNYCFQELGLGHHVTCAVNTRAGRETEFPAQPPVDGNGRKIVVVGAGPAGMEAARVLGARGFDVVLMEKTGELGGRLKAAGSGPAKDKIRWLKEYLVNELQQLPVSVRFNAEYSLDTLRAEKPYAVVLASGGEPHIPAISGLIRESVALAEDVVLGEAHWTGLTTAVIGGGFTGCEAAEVLADSDNAVTIIEMLRDMASDVEAITRMELLDILARKHVETLCSSKVTHIEDGQVTWQDLQDGSEHQRFFDRVVIAAGMVADTELVDEVRANFDRTFVLGDARRPGMISNAIRDGFTAGHLL